MDLSMRWLKDYVDVDLPPRAFCEGMTMSGSKVEGYEMEGAEISNVVVGQVLEMERHPDSDHLWVCKVDVGGEAPFRSSPAPRTSMWETMCPPLSTIPPFPAV